MKLMKLTNGTSLLKQSLRGLNQSFVKASKSEASTSYSSYVSHNVGNQIKQLAKRLPHRAKLPVDDSGPNVSFLKKSRKMRRLHRKFGRIYDKMQKMAQEVFADPDGMRNRRLDRFQNRIERWQDKITQLADSTTASTVTSINNLLSEASANLQMLEVAEGEVVTTEITTYDVEQVDQDALESNLTAIDEVLDQHDGEFSNDLAEEAMTGLLSDLNATLAELDEQEQRLDKYDSYATTVANLTAIRDQVAADLADGTGLVSKLETRLGDLREERAGSYFDLMDEANNGAERQMLQSTALLNDAVKNASVSATMVTGDDTANLRQLVEESEDAMASIMNQYLIEKGSAQSNDVLAHAGLRIDQLTAAQQAASADLFAQDGSDINSHISAMETVKDGFTADSANAADDLAEAITMAQDDSDNGAINTSAAFDLDESVSNLMNTLDGLVEGGINSELAVTVKAEIETLMTDLAAVEPTDVVYSRAQTLYGALDALKPELDDHVDTYENPEVIETTQTTTIMNRPDTEIIVGNLERILQIASDILIRDAGDKNIRETAMGVGSGGSGESLFVEVRRKRDSNNEGNSALLGRQFVDHATELNDSVNLVLDNAGKVQDLVLRADKLLESVTKLKLGKEEQLGKKAKIFGQEQKPRLKQEVNKPVGQTLKEQIQAAEREISS